MGHGRAEKTIGGAMYKGGSNLRGVFGVSGRFGEKSILAWVLGPEKQYGKTNWALECGYDGKRANRNVKPNCEPRKEHGGNNHEVMACRGIDDLLQRSCRNDRNDSSLEDSRACTHIQSHLKCRIMFILKPTKGKIREQF